MWSNSQFLADLVTFTEEILNGKLLFCARDWCQIISNLSSNFIYFTEIIWPGDLWIIILLSAFLFSSRQRYVLGDNAMQKLSKANLLIVGVGGVGVEVGKGPTLKFTGQFYMNLQNCSENKLPRFCISFQGWIFKSQFKY